MKPRTYAEWAEHVFVDPNESAMERAVYTNVEPEENENDPGPERHVNELSDAELMEEIRGLFS